MTLSEYQDWQEKTDLYNKRIDNGPLLLTLYALGLNGEAGEVAELVKRVYRDDKFDPDALKKELGDVLWYLARIARHAGIRLEDVLSANVEKINDRALRNVGHGTGDNR